MTEIARQLETIVGAEGICAIENAETSLQKQLTRAMPKTSPPDCIVYPKTPTELAEVITIAHQHRWRVLPCGSGSKLSWGGLSSGIQAVVSTERMNQTIDRATGDLTVTVEAGMKFSHLQQMLAEVGQFLALDPAYPAIATIGGIVATGDSGSLRQRYGGVRDQLIGFSFVRSDGKIAKAGGRVVKNVAGYDLMKLFTGSYGTLGIICQVTFRVYPQQAASQTVLLTGEAQAIAIGTQTLLSSALTPTAVDLLSTKIVANLGAGKGLGLLARFQSVEESVKEQSARLLEVGQKIGLQGTTYSEKDEAALWERLREQIEAPVQESGIICKIGVRPSSAVATLAELETILPPSGASQIRAGSGLGLVRFAEEDAIIKVEKMRSLCQSNGGFLTILEAPVEVKQKLDVWGYTGNALDLMRRIKQQFDGENILSPNRFVGGI